jgi:hypothetical protein
MSSESKIDGLKKHLAAEDSVCAVVFSDDKQDPDELVINNCVTKCGKNYIITQSNLADYENITDAVTGFKSEDYYMSNSVFVGKDGKKYPVYILRGKTTSDAYNLDNKLVTGTTDPMSKTTACYDLVYLVLTNSCYDKKVLDDTCVALSYAIAKGKELKNEELKILIDYEPLITLCNLLELNGSEFNNVQVKLTEEDIESLCNSLYVIKDCNTLLPMYEWYNTFLTAFNGKVSKISVSFNDAIAEGILDKIDKQTKKLDPEYNIACGWKIKVLRHMIRACLYTGKIKKIMYLIMYDCYDNCGNECISELVNSEDCINPRISKDELNKVVSKSIQETRLHGIIMSMKCFNERYNDVKNSSSPNASIGGLYGKVN